MNFSLCSLQKIHVLRDGEKRIISSDDSRCSMPWGSRKQLQSVNNANTLKNSVYHVIDYLLYVTITPCHGAHIDFTPNIALSVKSI